MPGNRYFRYSSPWSLAVISVGRRSYSRSSAQGFGSGAATLPLDMYLVQCGYPAWQSGFKAAVLVTNVALNLALIPRSVRLARRSQWPPPGR